MKNSVSEITEPSWVYNQEEDDFDEVDILVALQEIIEVTPWEKRIVRVLRENNTITEWNETFNSRDGWGRYDPILQEFVSSNELFEVHVGALS